jgi:predicted DNA-binding WGR domain protein
MIENLDVEHWYLELSEGTAHKFYEITREATQLTIRYGRIGDVGQMQQKKFADTAAAQAEAEKKIREKRKGGYTDAVFGDRAKKSVQRFLPMDFKEIQNLFAPWRAKYVRQAWLPVVESGDGSLTDSKFAGTPWLAVDEQEPVCGCCHRPLPLFLQLNLEQIPTELQRKFGQGLLQVFYCVNEDCALKTSGHACWEAFSPSHHVRLINAEGPSKTTSGLASNFAARRIVSWQIEEDYPSDREYGQFGISLDYQWGDDFEVQISCDEFGIFGRTEDEEAVALAIGDALEEDKLWGFPRWVQGIEYPTCPKCARRMEMVFQIGRASLNDDRRNNLDYDFGDGGIAHITQCSEHKEILALAWACS